MNQLLEQLLTNLDNYSARNKSMHLPRYVMSPIEEELLDLGKYHKKIPHGYPRDKAEQLGFRRTNDTHDATYKDMPIRVGSMKIHIAEKGSSKPLNAVVMLYMGNFQEQNILGVSTGISHDPQIVVLHENGIISSVLYLYPFIPLVSWAPQEKFGFGGSMYPVQSEDVVFKFQQILDRFNSDYPIETTILPDLVMLAKHTYYQSIK